MESASQNSYGPPPVTTTPATIGSAAPPYKMYQNNQQLPSPPPPSIKAAATVIPLNNVDPTGVQLSGIVPTNSILPSPPLAIEPSLSAKNTIYVKMTWKGCCTKQMLYEVYPGTKDKHDDKILTVHAHNEICICLLPCCCLCNMCAQCCCNKIKGNFDWPMPITDSKGNPYGLITLTESHNYPILLHAERIYQGRMRNSFEKCCFCFFTPHNDIIGKSEDMLWTTKHEGECSCLCICRCLCPCFNLCCGSGCCTCCDCDSLIRKYFLPGSNLEAFKIVEKCDCMKCLCCCCSSERHFEVVKGPNELKESQLLLIIPVIGHTYEG